MSINLKVVFGNLSPEDQAKAMLIKTPEELFDFASVRGVAITEDDAKALFAGNSGKTELTPEELDNVTGGWTCSRHNSEKCFNNNSLVRCVTAVTPACDHLKVVDTGQKSNGVDLYLLSCDKGHFRNLFCISSFGTYEISTLANK